MAAAVAEPMKVDSAPTNGTSLTKSQRERLKRKERKKRKQERKKETPETKQSGLDQSTDASSVDESVDVEIEYVAANPFENIAPDDGDTFFELRDVIAQFSQPKVEVKTESAQTGSTGEDGSENKEGGPSTAEQPKEEKLSKKKRKLQRRLPIAVLKQVVARPDLVEIHDTCAADPFLLMHTKAYHNTVSVPRHWSQKRKYLQGKRGIEKPPFDLPDFIKKTGIMEARSSGLEKDAEKSLKQKARERLNPGMNKIGIDYQVLHDAFFKHQTKPKLTGYGDLYYEGKEFEVEMKEKRPGVLSKELKEALGIPEGAPPPWLLNMQRVGPPPSYKNLKIPGLNAPIPPGAEYGYHPGGWGRPPQDDMGRPLYAEAWGEAIEAPRSQYIEIAHWGSLPEQLEELASSSDEEEEAPNEIGVESMETEYATGEEEVSGMETPLSGLETPQNIEGTLRKPTKKIDDSGEKQLYEVLEQRETSVGGELYGSSHTYVLDKNKSKQAKNPDRVDLMKSQKTESIDIALDPSELTTLTEEALKKRYDRAVEDKKSKSDKGGVETEEGSKKRKRSGSDTKKSKKFKEFQF